MAEAAAAMGPANTFDEALRQARLTEAAHHEAVLGIKDAKSLRLQVLKDEIAAVIAHSQEARQLFDLALAPGEPPKLWIDLITFVVMEPDYRTYRLVQDNQAGRDILLETAARREMAERLKHHMAHRIIARQRQMAATPPAGQRIGFSAGSLIVAGLSGFGLAIPILLILAILLGILKF
ncbi:MAG: hypothetical protein ACT4SY_07860 [Hyphomicrobiales bacterium]